MVTDLYRKPISVEPNLERKAFFFEYRCMYVKGFLFGSVLSVFSEVADHETGRKMGAKVSLSASREYKM